ncbi:MAG: hypothetical protein HC895_11495 [Leptolyngbyaceae cyanobacterium SM1_3_5]|nr:hypothetical protein [Leptolyngbyaceae cyanobacterium SM1_3_5]
MEPNQGRKSIALAQTVAPRSLLPRHPTPNTRPPIALQISLMRKSGSLPLLCSFFLLTLLLSSCDRLRFVQQQAEARFTIRVSGSTPGIYAVDGTANLPDGTKINVIALRYLEPGNAASAKLNPNPTYSILAYQSIEVSQGEWQYRPEPCGELLATGGCKKTGSKNRNSLASLLLPTNKFCFSPPSTRSKTSAS